jgi:hypothetical protein
VVQEDREVRLQDVMADPTFHLLLCGPLAAWDEEEIAAVGDRYGRILKVHRLTREAEDGALRDTSGEAFARLGVQSTGVYLVRPDGHIGFRAIGPNLELLNRYLETWLPAETSLGLNEGPGEEPRASSKLTPPGR